MRADTILILRIFPDLLYIDTGLARIIGIDKIIACLGRSVILNGIFTDRIVDLLPFFIFWQSGKLIAPVAILIRFDLFTINFCTIGHQTNRDTVWSGTILVVIIFPGLCTGDIYRFRLMTVLDHKSICGITTDWSIISIYLVFLYSIGDGFSCFIDI